jgi:hypothetical protein
MGKPKRRKESLKRPSAYERKSGDMSTEELLRAVLKLLEGKDLPQEEEKEVESWLDWGMGILKELGPMALELAPSLLALL